MSDDGGKLHMFEAGLRSAVQHAERLQRDIEASAARNGNSYLVELHRYGMGISGLDDPPILDQISGD